MKQLQINEKKLFTLKNIIYSAKGDEVSLKLNIWNSLIEKFFSKIEVGKINITFPDGKIKSYGNDGFLNTSLHIHKDTFFRRVLLYGDIGFAESYIDKDFDIDDMTSFLRIIIANSKNLSILSEDEKNARFINLFPQLNRLKHIMKKNSKTKARKNISEHYDLSNNFFELMLDNTMMYSSAIFKDKETSLYDAQINKLEVLANKLNVDQNSHVLEIGSGWGEMACFLAKEKGCRVTTVTLSIEQKKYAQQKIKENNLEDKVTVLLKDYRDIEGKYDGIVSIEMFEAVGKEYFDVFFQKCQELLKENALLVMQVITIPDQRYKAYSKGTDFIQKYIFPGGHLPSVSKMLECTTKSSRLNLLNLEDYTEHYAKTLNIWYKNFQEKSKEITNLGFDEYFMRMWTVYLNYCEAGFLNRSINLTQFIFTKDQNMGLNKGL